METVGIIGAGQIGSALAKIIAETGRYHVIASRRNLSKIKDLEGLGIELTRDNKIVASKSDIIIVSVKPHKAFEVLKEISEEVRNKIVISVAAAIPLDRLIEAAPEAKIVRAMPNINILVKASFTAYSVGPNLKEDDLKKVQELFRLMGEYIEVEEELMDAITALSGSGPAYVSTLIEAMAYAGLKVGLPRELAYYSAAYTVLGSAKLYLDTRLHPSVIKEMVLTPAGVYASVMLGSGKQYTWISIMRDLPINLSSATYGILEKQMVDKVLLESNIERNSLTIQIEYKAKLCEIMKVEKIDLKPVFYNTLLNSSRLRP